MKTLEIGIADYDRMKARTLAIARGEHTPASDEPKVWFPSREALAEARSDGRLELIRHEAHGSLPNPGAAAATQTPSGNENRRLSSAGAVNADGIHAPGDE